MREFDLVITAPTGAATDNISGSTIHICLDIAIRSRHGKLNTLSTLWTAQSVMTVDEINMLELEMLSNMAKQLAKARDLSNNSTAVFGSLPIFIVMGDFYQFPSIIGHPLWEEFQTDEDHNGKTLWLSFSLVIMLTKQMQH